MSYDREDFRAWLASHEGDEQPFNNAECPIVLWRRYAHHEVILNAAAHEGGAWCRGFVWAVDAFCDRKTPGGWWSDLTAKEALTLLDDLEVGS